MADHAAHLTARHPDRAEHADLARPLEDGQDECVDDPEQAHDHRQRKQHVEDVEDRAEAGDLIVDELLPRRRLRVRELLQRAVQSHFVRVGLPATHEHERVEILRVGHVAVPGRGGDGDAAERRAAGRRVEDALHVEELLGAVGEGERHRRAQREVMTLRVVLVDERSVLAERRQHACRALLPVQVEHAAGRRIDGSGRDLVPERKRFAGADVRDGDHTGRLRDRVRGGDRDRIEVVLRGDRVVRVLPDVLHGPAKARDDAGRQDRHQGHEREADH